MRRGSIDYFIVPDNQLGMHERLLNWSRWVRPGVGSASHPMWRQGRSNSRQWHTPEIRDTVNTLDGHKVEKGVSALPEKHRAAIRWAYVTSYQSPTRIRRELGVTADGLLKLIQDARSMLVNRGV
jgi:hypothetical protein